MVKIPSINAPRTDVSLLQQTTVNMLKVLLTIEKTFMRLKNQEHDNKVCASYKAQTAQHAFSCFCFHFYKFCNLQPKIQKKFSAFILLIFNFHLDTF